MFDVTITDFLRCSWSFFCDSDLPSSKQLSWCFTFKPHTIHPLRSRAFICQDLKQTLQVWCISSRISKWAVIFACSVLVKKNSTHGEILVSHISAAYFQWRGYTAIISQLSLAKQKKELIIKHKSASWIVLPEGHRGYKPMIFWLWLWFCPFSVFCILIYVCWKCDRVRGAVKTVFYRNNS